MQFEYSPYILPLLAAAIVSAIVVLYAWMRRSANGALALFVLAIFILEWIITYLLEIMGADLETKYFWGVMEYIGIAFVPYSWLRFSITYSGQERIISRRFLALAALIPSITVLLAWTTRWHGLVWSEYHIAGQGDFSALAASYGPWFFVHLAYSYITLLVGAFFLIRVLRRKGMYRGQAVAMLIAVLAPWVGNALFLTGNSPIPYLDLTPFAFTVSVAAVAWAVFGFRFMDITPLARDSVVDSMREGMVVLDVSGNVIDINNAATHMIGIPVEYAIGKTAEEIFLPWANLVERFRNAIDARDEITVGEGEAKRRFEVRLSPLQDQQGQLVGRVILLRSTDAEVLLLESEIRFRQIVENVSDIIYRTDMNGNFTYVNPSALKMMGYAGEEEVLGRNYLDLTTPEFRQKLKRFYDHQYLGKIQDTYYEFPVVTVDGQIIWVGQNVRLIQENEQIVGFQAVARNITQLKQTQEALALSRDQALDASRFKSQLLSRVSHELRTPLGGILGYAELLQYKTFGPLTEKQDVVLSNIIESTHYLTNIVSDLLDEAQIESKSLGLRNEYFAPVDLCEKIRSTMSTLANKKGLTFSVDLAPDLPSEIYGDTTRLLQVIMNLAGNAVKFTREGGVNISLKRLAPTYWSIEVRDSGVGIPENERQNIFEPFRQVNNPITRENRGSGLGLAITKQLVELMGGQISLESQIGKGSLFIVTLPIINAPGE